MQIALIGYNFEHRKTQDFIFRLLSEGYEVKVILAADKKKLNIPSSSIRKSVRFKALLHPKKIAEAFNIPFEVVDHNSKTIKSLVDKYDAKLGIISGARILSEDTINAFEDGIINFHPGLIPESRGLDSVLWSIYNGIPLGVTAHLIDTKIDSGSILCKKEVRIEKDDQLADLFEKVYSLELNLISKAIEAVRNNSSVKVESEGNYHSKMPETTEKEVSDIVYDYIKKFI